MKKVYTIRKFVVADTILEALKKERDQEPDDIFLNDDHAKAYIAEIAKEETKIGL